MRQLTSEFVNGAIFAALVVLTSQVQGATLEPRPGEISPPPTVGGPATGTGSEAVTARTGSFAPVLARSSFAGDDRARAAVADPGEAGALAPVKTFREALTVGAAPAATQGSAAALPEAVVARPSQSKIDAFVPPIRRQRPVTPPLAFGAPREKPAAGSSRKGAKAPVKRAAGRKAPEAPRSSLAAGAKVANGGAAAPADQAQTKSQQ